MKHYKKVDVPQTTKDVLEFTTCDWCGERFKWLGNSESDEVTVERENSTHWPECGSSRTESFDICTSCWDEKLKPWLLSQGLNPRVEERNW